MCYKNRMNYIFDAGISESITELYSYKNIQHFHEFAPKFNLLDQNQK